MSTIAVLEVSRFRSLVFAGLVRDHAPEATAQKPETFDGVGLRFVALDGRGKRFGRTGFRNHKVKGCATA
jgi:hypothetical protein